MYKQLLSLCILFFSLTESFAQVRGTTSSQTKPLPFNHSFNNVTLDPNPTVGAGSRVQFVQHFDATQSPEIGLNTVINLIGGDFNIPGWLTDLGNDVPFFCAGFTPSFNINGSIDVGGYYQVRSVGNSNIDVDYPVQVHITYPQANTFACGETIRINTSYDILQPAATKLRVKPPFVNQEIGPVLNNLTFGASIGVNAWVGFGVSVPYPCETGVCYHDICSNKQYFNESVSFNLSPNLPSLPSLVNFCESGFGPGANNASLLSCNWSAATPFLNLGQSALDAYNATHGSNYTFATFPDYNTVNIAPPDFAGGPTIPEMEGTFKDIGNTEMAYSYLNNGRKLTVNGTKSSISQLSFDLSSLLDYAGVTTSKSLGGGLGSIDVGDISPTFTVDQTLNFEYDPVVHLQVNMGASMAYSVHNSNGSLDHTGNGQIVQLTAGQYIDAVVPSGRTTAMNASGISNLDGSFSSQSSQEYYRSLMINLGQVKMTEVIDFTLYHNELFKAKFGEKGILNHNFNLALPNSISLPSFVLDPENPVIDVTYMGTEDVRNIGGGKRKVIYKLGLTNEGDVNLSDVQSTINLAAAFAGATGYEVVCINSDDLIVNSGFNGDADKNLLATGNMLSTGQTKYMELVVELTPAKSAILANGCFGTVDYTIASKATATSPIGTAIQSDYNQCTLQTTGTDITTYVDLGAEKIIDLQDFTVYGWEEVHFDKFFTTSYGNVGSGEDMEFHNVSHKDLPAVTIIGDLHVNDRFRLKGESKLITDNLQLDGVPDIHNKSALYPTGAVSNNSGCVVSIPQPYFPAPANNSNIKIDVDRNTTFTLYPGSYEKVTVDKHATLILTSGTYYMDTWQIKGENVQVKYQLNGQPITIHVNKFKADEKDTLQMKLDGPGQVSDIRINVYSNHGVKFRNSFIQGIIMAPRAHVEFKDDSQLEGAVYAEKVKFKSGSVFKGTKYTLPLNVNPACQESQSFARPGAYVTNPNQTIPPQYDGPVYTENPVLNVAEKKSVLTAGANVLQGLAIYPNPIADQFMILGLQPYQNKMIQVFDIQGQMLKQVRITGAYMRMSLMGVKSGLYFLKIAGEEPVFKIVKQ